MEPAAVKSTPLHPVMVGSSNTVGQDAAVLLSLTLLASVFPSF